MCIDFFIPFLKTWVFEIVIHFTAIFQNPKRVTGTKFLFSQ